MPSKGVVFILKKCSLPFKLFCLSCAYRLPVEKSQYSINIHTQSHTHEIFHFLKEHFKFRDSDFSFTSGGLPLRQAFLQEAVCLENMEHSPKMVKCSKWSLSVNKSSLPSMGIPLKGENPAQYAVCLV